MTSDRSGLLEAYLKHRQDLVRHFARRLGSEAAAEDLVQEIYLRIRAKAPDRPLEKPAGYLFRLGANLMMDRVRSDRRTAARDEAWRDSEHAVMGGVEVSDEPAADDAVAAKQRLARLVEAVETLPPGARRVFVMHKFEALSYGEVAAALGISVSAVEKHMIKALRALAEKVPS